jgi:hypothetical protein
MSSGILVIVPAHAFSLADLSAGDASQGLKLALEKGASVAISLLGAEGGFMGNDKALLENHVTGKTLDGLYYMIGEEEKKIRQNPAQAGSALLSKVFGALR